MSQSGLYIAGATAMGIRYADRLLNGISDERFARMSAPGGELVVANHPAFILGHLCLYPEKVATLLNGFTPAAGAPANYDAIFSKTATCQDDPDNIIYPSSGEIKEVFITTYQAAISCITAAEESVLALENPVDTPMKSVLPTLGAMLNFYLTSHVMIHLGQLSTWRRMEGLAPA